MSFYVGQRVRIRWSLNWPELAGAEGTVKGVSDEETVHPGIFADFVVAPDCWGSEFAPVVSQHGAMRFAPCADQLEPIQPEGMKPASWADCAWKPEHLRGVKA